MVEMLKWLRRQPPSGAFNSRIRIVAALHRAFMLSVEDLSAVGAWHVFPGGTWSDEKLEQFLAPRIQATRSQWMP
ncbi:hypothetical protein D7X74_39625 [Corallococcus sp. CA047B]|nr:hypothetical protein D7X74_39625 [Corallococcus sp. CA047B]